jgi:hypothetical protein
MKHSMSYTLRSGQIATGTVYNEVQLSAKFQIWAREYNVTDAESLAMWILDTPEKHRLYFSGSKEVETLATSGFAKIRSVEIPNLDCLPESEIRFAAFTIETA